MMCSSCGQTYSVSEGPSLLCTSCYRRSRAYPPQRHRPRGFKVIEGDGEGRDQFNGPKSGPVKMASMPQAVFLPREEKSRA